jgi:carbon-monoxide dehydrogenase medium subunit
MAIAAARAGLISVGPTPVVIDLAESLAGRPHDAAAPGAVARHVESMVDPDSDIHATAEYRRHVSGVLAARAVRTAIERALEAAS